MDVKYVNPFCQAVLNVMPQLGFSDIKKGMISVEGKEIKSIGVSIIIGIVGDFKGNVVYSLSVEDAKKIASTMMMGMPVDELNEMALSALSELSNMLTANAATVFSEEEIEIDISTPTVMHGNFDINASSDKVLKILMLVNEMPFELNISIDGMKS